MHYTLKFLETLCNLFKLHIHSNKTCLFWWGNQHVPEWDELKRKQTKSWNVSEWKVFYIFTQTSLKQKVSHFTPFSSTLETFCSTKCNFVWQNLHVMFENKHFSFQLSFLCLLSCLSKHQDLYFLLPESDFSCF